jgi:SAM-dependent methyltransferase
MSAPRTRGRSGGPGRWGFWKFNWLVNHKLNRAIERARVHARGQLLDVGCGSKPFAPLFEGRIERYWGTDLRGSHHIRDARVDAYARAEAQPFRDQSFDTVIGLRMLYGLPEPILMLEEAHRVLRPGGMLLLEFTQMAPVYDAPWDFYRFTRYGADHLLRKAGFETVECLAIGGLWSRVGLTAIGGLNRINRGPTRWLTEVPVRVLYVVVQLACEGLDRVFFDAGEVLGHLVVARRSHEARFLTPPAGRV